MGSISSFGGPSSLIPVMIVDLRLRCALREMATLAAVFGTCEWAMGAVIWRVRFPTDEQARALVVVALHAVLADCPYSGWTLQYWLTARGLRLGTRQRVDALFGHLPDPRAHTGPDKARSHPWMAAGFTCCIGRYANVALARCSGF